VKLVYPSGRKARADAKVDAFLSGKGNMTVTDSSVSQ